MINLTELDQYEEPYKLKFSVILQKPRLCSEKAAIQRILLVEKDSKCRRIEIQRLI